MCGIYMPRMTSTTQRLSQQEEGTDIPWICSTIDPKHTPTQIQHTHTHTHHLCKAEVNKQVYLLWPANR